MEERDHNSIISSNAASNFYDIENKTDIGDDIEQSQSNCGQGQGFGMITVVALAFVICNSWAGVSSSSQLALQQDGPVTLLYGMIGTTVAYLSIALSLGELASVYPTAGGQYHFAYILAPSDYKRPISYTCGLLALFSWIAIGATVTMVPAEIIMSLVVATNPTFEAETWQVFLIYQGMALMVLIINLFILKRASWLHAIGFLLSLCLFLTIVIAILVRSDLSGSSKAIWATFTNASGWPDGVSFILGLSSSCFMYTGLDAAMHVAEDCRDPRRAAPVAMISAVAIGFVTAFGLVVVQLYGITDMNAILTTDGYVPLLVLDQCLNSGIFAAVLIILCLILTVFILNAVQETSSRLAWSLAKDHGLILSPYLSSVHPVLRVPVWSLFSTYFLLVVCGCVYLASAAAFGALVTSTTVLQQLSFVIPIALLVCRGRSSEYLPRDRSFALPSWLGWTANSIVIIFTTVTVVFFNFPDTLPTTAGAMNYTCAILGVAFLIGVINWFLYARKRFQGPSIDNKLINSSDLSLNALIYAQR